MACYQLRPCITCVSDGETQKRGCRNVREPAIATPDRNIENQVEFLIERRILVSADVPRVGQESTVFVVTLEMAALPEILFLEVDVENLLEWIVDPCIKIIFRPFETECMVAFGIVGSLNFVFFGSSEKVVGLPRGT
jgi:hypothetical protein